MSFSSRRRNYLLTPHRRDGLIEWMKSMLQHSFVLDALETTGGDTFSHFEELIEEHRLFAASDDQHQPSRLQQLVSTIGVFHTPLPLRAAFEVYNAKHRLTKRKHIQISFNEIRHILNLAQIMSLRKAVPTDGDDVNDPLMASMSRLMEPHSPAAADDPDESQQQQQQAAAAAAMMDGESSGDEGDDDSDVKSATAADGDIPQWNGPRLISFDGDQTLYSDGQNFERNPRLANYLYQLLRHGVAVAVVTAAGYEYKAEKYEYRLSGLLQYFKTRGLTEEECERFYLFGGECNYLLQMRQDYRLHPVREDGPDGWMTSTKHLVESPANWDERDIQLLLDTAEIQVAKAIIELNLRGQVIRKRRSVGLVPLDGQEMTRESLDEVVLRIREELHKLNDDQGVKLPFCVFNGGGDDWCDLGNKRVGVQVLQSFLGIPGVETLHIGDQFLNTGNDFAARDVSPCIWIVNPQETTYILKSILRLAGVSVHSPDASKMGSSIKKDGPADASQGDGKKSEKRGPLNFVEVERRAQAAKQMDVYTGDMK